MHCIVGVLTGKSLKGHINCFPMFFLKALHTFKFLNQNVKHPNKSADSKLSAPRRVISDTVTAPPCCWEYSTCSSAITLGTALQGNISVNINSTHRVRVSPHYVYHQRLDVNIISGKMLPEVFPNDGA